MVLQAEEPEDWVIATGKKTSVRDFVKMAFAELGIELEFRGKGMEERAYIAYCQNPDFQMELGTEVVSVDPMYFRPTEVDQLLGDATKARIKLGWVPECDIQQLVKEMMSSDLTLMRREHHLNEVGFKTYNYFE